ncbi:hypothetical protein OTU49_003365 [Cherax quadricarinatus]|uniref:Uncharacterized protein n=1 Tax=Cherax quadricarinatus TaxID=27406 RepID=A0AAW0X4T8_CHEQU
MTFIAHKQVCHHHNHYHHWFDINSSNTEGNPPSDLIIGNTQSSKPHPHPVLFRVSCDVYITIGKVQGIGDCAGSSRLLRIVRTITYLHDNTGSSWHRWIFKGLFVEFP